MISEYDISIASKVFNSVYLQHLNNLSRTQIYFGGSASGKSKFLSQRTIYDILQGGRNYLITRQVGRTIRGSVFTEINKVINEWELENLFQVNKSDMLITCENGYQIIFAGLDDVEKLKSLTPSRGEITDVWVEEATEIEKNSLKQLYKRQRGGSEKTSKRITLSFNPILQTHWLYKDYFASLGWADEQTEYNNGALSILKTTYKDNKFLTSDDIKDLENETDPYYYSVYTLGNWGILGNVIFTNFRIEDLSSKRDQFTNRRVGLDFGFASDPAAMPVTHYDKARKTIYVYDEIYETGLTNDTLAIEISRKTGDRVVCDSSEPKSIAELNKYGVYAVGAKKGKDSVKFGIDWLKQQTIVIDKACVNFANEIRQYKWKEDAGGNAIPVPVDKNNHLIDALRYAYEDDMDGFSPRSVIAFAG